MGTTIGGTGGVGGADNVCMDDFVTPSNGSFKALLVDGSNRIASVTANSGDGQVAWVLKPNTDYVRVDGISLFTTNANAITDFTLQALSNSITTSAAAVWTGMNTDWTASDIDCNDWSSGSDTVVGTLGDAQQTDAQVLSAGTESCDVQRKLICVEQ